MGTDTKSGFLSKSGATVAAGIGLFLGVAYLGWKARDVISPALASTPSNLELRLNKLDQDMLLIKCRLNIESVCPPLPAPPIRTSGFTP